MKKRLAREWEENFSKSSNRTDFFTPLQEKLFPIINEYNDLYFDNKTIENDEELRDIYVLHTINHVFKS